MPGQQAPAHSTAVQLGAACVVNEDTTGAASTSRASMAAVTDESTAQLLPRAFTCLGALVLGLLAVLAGPTWSVDTAGVAALAAMVLGAALVRRSVSFVPRQLRPSVPSQRRVAACQVALRDPDAPGRGSRPRAPDRGSAPAR